MLHKMSLFFLLYASKYTTFVLIDRQEDVRSCDDKDATVQILGGFTRRWAPSYSVLNRES